MADITGHNNKAASEPERQRIFRETLQRADEFLHNRLQVLLQKADDLFFDLSNRATTNAEQNAYFEAMREIRAKQPAVLAAFREAREHLLQQARTPARDSDTKTDSSGRPLELLRPEELEQNVAVAGMVSKCRAVNGKLLRDVGYRLGWLVHSPLNERNNPLDPQQVCQSFTQATQGLDLHIKARLVLLKQFDQQVIHVLPELLTGLDCDLRIFGFIPDPPLPGQESAQPAARRTESTFNDLAALLSSLRAFGISIPSAPRISRANNSVPMPSSELVEGITRLQNLYTHKQQSGAREIRAVIQQLLAERNRTGQPSALAPMDEDVINLVALFFDYVLGDDSLPPCIQLLISRLQLQVLKSAIRNPGFFNDPDHPARLFIECVASAGIGCDDGHPGNPVFAALQASVQAILDDPQGSDRVFARETDRISDIMSHEQRKSALIEKRTSESAQGQARARHAKTVVQNTLYQSLRDRYLPEAILNFLTTTWRDVMFQVYLKFAADSLEWEESLSVVKDMILCANESRRADSHESLTLLTRTLLARITRLSDKAATPAAVASITFRNLETVFLRLAAGEGPAVPLVPLGPLHAEALGQSLANAIGSWDQEIAQQHEERKYASLNFESLRKADGMETGTWLLRQDPLHPGNGQRCKLAARIAETDSYIFVDANGFRLFEIPRRSVAHELQRGKLRVLNDSPLFERAVESITRNIHQLTGEITANH